MRTFEQGGEQRASMPADKPREPALSATPRDPELWEKTDRQLRYPGRHHTFRNMKEGSRISAAYDIYDRWLEEHRVQTEFVDAGIGCCWLAQQGDGDPVMGETEAEAVLRLAEENSLPWPNARNA